MLASNTTLETASVALRLATVQKAKSPESVIELWKAIHGGCWPGPEPDLRLTRAVEEVIAGLAVHNLANAFQEGTTRQALQKVAIDSLGKSLGALQQQLNAKG